MCDVDIQVAIFKTLRGKVGSDVSKTDRVASSRDSSFHKNNEKMSGNCQSTSSDSRKETKVVAIKWMLNQGGS